MKQITKLLYILFILLTAASVNAQQTKPTASVSGLLHNEQEKPLDYATVTLLRAKDSSVVKGTLTNDAGNYLIDRVTAGKYIIKATNVGYQPTFSAAFEVSAAQPAVNAPLIKMRQSSRTLQGVTVTSSKPLIERKLDRTVMNVENSVLAAGNSALEILERAPGVTIDKDDNITLKGKQGVTVMINDKLTYLSSTQLAALLRSTDGTTIQSIEIITNPSARYDASGNSGIINIKLKKNKQSGTNGSLTAGVAYGKNFRDNTSLNLNHKVGNLSVFGTLSHGDLTRENIIDINRTVISGPTTTYFMQNTLMKRKLHYNNFRVGADYNTSSKNTLGFVVSGDHTNEYNNNKSVTKIGSTPFVVDSVQNTPTSVNQTYRNIAVNLNDKLVIDTSGQEISIDLDYSKFKNNSFANNDTYFFLPDGSVQHPSLFLRNQTPSSIRIYTGKVDYTYPINKTLKLEAGIKASSVKTDNDLRAEIESSGTFINDTSRTNRFVYDESVSAAYFNLGQTFKNTSVQIGLRAERTVSTGNLITYSQVVHRSYLDLFPSLFINQTISAKHEVGFNFSRRIDRPDYDNLNPFVYYLDQYTYEKGNPFLKPQYTNSFELSYTYNKNINVTLGYSHTTDASVDVLYTDTVKKATYKTNENLQTRDNYNININTPYTITKWWTGNLDVTGFYQKFKSASLYGSMLSNGQAAFQGRATQTFLVPGYKFELSAFYQSASSYSIFKLKSQYAVDAGVSHSFYKKKMNIKLAVSDIFNTRKNRLSTDYGSTNLNLVQKNETRVARLTFTYNFGNSKIKARKHQTGAEDEKGRVKSGG
ncbi:TonB-dependent receptor [Mucilaginibacter terrigena]|uniref:TonB-dependent receptor n=1 Tax=Mucilaginibacter terrigena TaxID=2492395 RepID=A0A4V1ZBM1_9SPHI|nr:outer membrane beta-barrel family protein [Mucilaginibacter terrigena]RYU89407.1 TonB-dependent receptor [Mucilaginibacter terrigena]